MKKEEIVLVYDKACPVCRCCAEDVRIEQQFGQLKSADAHVPGALMDEITKKGWDVDEGIVLKVDETFYYGPDAIHALALLSSRNGIFNRFNYWVFKSEKFSALVYCVFWPGLKVLRRMLLKFSGVSAINNLGEAGNEKVV